MLYRVLICFKRSLWLLWGTAVIGRACDRRRQAKYPFGKGYRNRPQEESRWPAFRGAQLVQRKLETRANRVPDGLRVGLRKEESSII